MADKDMLWRLSIVLGYWFVSGVSLRRRDVVSGWVARQTDNQVLLAK